MVKTLKCCILTEGGILSGFGHITRCISFYDAFIERGHDVEFLIQGDESINTLLDERKFKLLNWHKNVRTMVDYLLNFDVVLLDSFQVVQDEIDFLCIQPFLFVSIDDYLRNAYHNTIIIDWTINVEKSDAHLQNKDNNNDLLLGIDYAVLRKPFWNITKRRFYKLKNVLISLGGSDIRGILVPLTNHLSNLFKDLNFHLIIGTNNEINNKLKVLTKENLQIYESISADKVKLLMDHSDLAISAGGQTLYELASVGLPTIAIQIIDNQIEDINGWKLKGLLYKVIDWNDNEIFNKISEALNDMYPVAIRKKIYNNSKNFIKGNNIFRIIDLIESRSNAKNRE